MKEITSPDKTDNTHKIPDSVWRSPPAHTAGKVEVIHPAVFPVALVAIAIRSWPGLIFDPFLGSGTTIIASEQLGRRCFGLEIEPRYCDVILNRWAKFTGKDPIREDGAKWIEVNRTDFEPERKSLLHNRQ